MTLFFRLLFDELRLLFAKVIYENRWKINGIYQDELERESEPSFDFIDISFRDNEHKDFHRTTMK